MIWPSTLELNWNRTEVRRSLSLLIDILHVDDEKSDVLREMLNMCDYVGTWQDKEISWNKHFKIIQNFKQY